jgi:hypothetical protein
MGLRHPPTPGVWFKKGCWLGASALASLAMVPGRSRLTVLACRQVEHPRRW